MNILEEQRNILFEACKKIATDQKCPKWIADYLRDQVMLAKQVKEKVEFPDLEDKEKEPVVDKPIEVNDTVIVTNNGCTCTALIIAECIPVDNTRLFDIKIVKGDSNNLVNQIYTNIPETMMKRI